jgi:hypothetical protein
MRHCTACRVVSSGSSPARRPAQPDERLGEVAQRLLVGLLGPEQPDERRAGVWPVGLNGKVGQQRADLVAVEARDRHAVALHLERSQEGYRLLRHIAPTGPHGG